MAKKTKDTDDEYAQFLDEISKSIDELDRPYRESRHTRARREARAKRAAGDAGSSAAAEEPGAADAALAHESGLLRRARTRMRRGADAAGAATQGECGDGAAEEAKRADRSARKAQADAGEPTRFHAGGRGRAQGAPEQAKSLLRRAASAIVRHPFVSVLVVVLVAIALVVGGFFWNRSLRYDDAADFQGTWYIEGTTTAVDITDDSIQLTSDVAYRYELDTHDKLIDFTFGNMSGAGRYWFSDDRTKLVIIDGTEYTGAKTLQEDVARAFASLACKIEGKAYMLPSGEGVTVLDRSPYVAQATAQDASAADQSESAPADHGASASESAASSSAASAQGSTGAGAASGSASASASESDAAGSSGAESASESAPQAGSFDNPTDAPYSSSSAKKATGQAAAGAASRG